MFYGLDVHKQFIQVCALAEDGEVRGEYRIDATRTAILAFGATLTPTDALVLEATFHSWAIHNLLVESGARVLVANPMQVKAIAYARVKTDKVDARTLAQLLRVGLIPEVRMLDHRTWQLRQLTSHRRFLVKERTAAKNVVHAILSQHLIEYTGRYLWSKPGREWLLALPLMPTEKFLLESALEVVASLDARVDALESLVQAAARDLPDAQLLMTIPGVHTTAAVGLLSAIGDVTRFASAKQLAAYFGLVPSINQSADRCYYGSITKTGRSTARWLAIEAANALVRSNTPITATYHRVRKKRGHNVALTAVARKLVVLIWHMLSRQQPYRYAPADRTRVKLRTVCRSVSDPRRAGVPKGLPAAYAEAGLPPLTKATRAELAGARRNLREIGVSRRAVPSA